MTNTHLNNNIFINFENKYIYVIIKKKYEYRHHKEII